MAGYDLDLKVKARFHAEAKAFLKFLQNIGRKYPVDIRYRSLRRGRYYVTIDGTPGGRIDALFQELILNRGLYYYVSSLRSGNRRLIAANVIAPIYKDLLESRFRNTFSRVLVRHILGRIDQHKFIPGDFTDRFSHDYEILFRKWDLGLLDDWNFLKDVDSLLNQFMLSVISHPPGGKSPKFHVLVDLAFRKGIAMSPELKGIFNKIHDARTQGLHRLRNNLTTEAISGFATRLYIYFEFFDEFQESQKVKTDKLHGKLYRRIKYGNEIRLDDTGKPYSYPTEKGIALTWSDITAERCYDCAAIKGQYHCFGCDVEQCPRCKGQRLGCPCKLQKDY
jgi:hypothetical protein